MSSRADWARADWSGRMAGRRARALSPAARERHAATIKRWVASQRRAYRAAGPWAAHGYAYARTYASAWERAAR